MISCNPRVLIVSGYGSVEGLPSLTEEGFGVLFLNPGEPSEIGSERPIRENFDPKDSAITWVFRNVESLDVVVNQLHKIRKFMEEFEEYKNAT